MPGRLSRSEFRFQKRSRELGRVLEERRHLLKFSRSELSERSRISPAAIQAIEKNTTQDPGLFTVIALAVALNLDLGDMMRSLTVPVKAKDIEPLAFRPARAPDVAEGRTG